MKPTDLIRHFEGCRLESYQDEVGVWTIGWGMTGPGIGPELVWSQAQADNALDARVAGLRANLGTLLRAPLSADQYAAVLSLVWNIGLAAFSRSTVLRRINAFDYAGAAAAWTDPATIFNKVRKDGKLVVSDGLSNRRSDEAAVFMLGTDQTPPSQPFPQEVS